MGERPPEVFDDTEMAYAQAKRYGQDLVRVYKQEKAKRQDLEIANQKLSTVWATAPNGLAVLDEQMRIAQANPRFESLVEYDGACAGRYLTDLVPSSRLASALVSAARDGTPFSNIEVSLSRPTNRTVQVSGAALAAGEQRGWVISLSDLTEHKRLEGLKEEFIDIAAHELRTPLAIILGFASVLSEDLAESHDTSALAPIEAIVGAANRLKMIINELVEFAAARSHSTGETQAVDQFDLWKVVEHAVGTLQYHADEVGVNIDVEAAGGPLTVSGDRVMIAEALSHLLENGVKYNRRGGTVTIRAAQEDGGTILEIEDTGIGIPAVELERVFEMFYQVEEHMTRALGGLGMGLSIARRAIELHGGRIEVNSTVGRGSVFRVILPPASQQPSVLPQSRLDSAHRQTLAYGRDLARTFTAQRALSQRLRRVSELGRRLEASLDGRKLEEALKVAQEIRQEAAERPDARDSEGP